MTSLPALPRWSIPPGNNEAYELPLASTSCLWCWLVINPRTQTQRLIQAASTKHVALVAYLISPQNFSCPLSVRFKSYIKTVVEHGVWIRQKAAEEFNMLIIFNLYHIYIFIFNLYFNIYIFQFIIFNSIPISFFM